MGQKSTQTFTQSSSLDRHTFLLVVIIPAFIRSLSLIVSFPDPCLLIDTSRTRPFLLVSAFVLVVISSSSSGSSAFSSVFFSLSSLSLRPALARLLLKASGTSFTSSSADSCNDNNQTTGLRKFQFVSKMGFVILFSPLASTCTNAMQWIMQGKYFW